MTSPKISVIIPIYGAEHFIVDALESLRQETFQNWEAWLVDDGSKDRSAEIATDVVRKDSRFRLICQRNTGVSGARNRGLTYATAPWIEFFDPDDILLPHAMEWLLEAAEKTHSDLVDGEYLLIDEDTTRAEVHEPPKDSSYEPQPETKAMLHNRVFHFTSSFNCVPWNCLWRHEAIRGLRFKVGSHTMEDLLFRFQALRTLSAYARIREPVVAYRTRPTSLSQVKVPIPYWTVFTGDLIAAYNAVIEHCVPQGKQLKIFRKSFSSRIKLHFYGPLRRIVTTKEDRRAMREALLKLRAAGIPLYARVPLLRRFQFWLFVNTGLFFGIARARL